MKKAKFVPHSIYQSLLDLDTADIQKEESRMLFLKSKEKKEEIKILITSMLKNNI